MSNMSDLSRDEIELRDRKIRKLRKQGLTLRAIGEQYNVTRERIRQICQGIPKPDLKTYYDNDCVVCGTTFTVSSDSKNKQTCSDKCLKKIQAKNNYKNGRWTGELIKLECHACGCEFHRTKRWINQSNHKNYRNEEVDIESKNWYCSKECYYERNKDKDV